MIKDSQEIIDYISPTDALSILKNLAETDQQLAQRIAKLTLEHLEAVEPAEVAASLYEQLETLQVEEVWDRAGSTRYGYIEPGEAADDMVEAVLTPYLVELKKYQQLGLTLEAKRLCLGLINGLYRFEQESSSEFKEWALGSSIVFTQVVLEAWKNGAPSPAAIQAVKSFAKEELDGWGAGLI